MRRITCLTLLAACLFAARGAAAQPLDGSAPQFADQRPGGAGGLGIGVAAMLTGLSGASVAYDGGPWHLDSMISFAKADGPSPGNRLVFGLGGRFWFHLHKTSSSDFSVGGGLGFLHNGPAGDDDDTVVSLEGGILLRAFIASNVALGVSAGLGIVSVDRTQVGLDGQFIGAAGIHYYFR